MVLENFSSSQVLEQTGGQVDFSSLILEQVKSLLGWQEIPPSQLAGKTEILQFILKLIVAEVKNYCHIKEIPTALLDVIALMIVDVYRQTDLGKEIVSKEPTSVSRGDVTVSYKVPFERSNDTMRNSTYIMQNSVFMKDYYKQLNAFRKLPW